MSRGAASAWLPYCGAAPSPADWFERWNFDPVLIVAIAGIAIVLWHKADGAFARRSLAGAVVLALLLFVSPLCAMSSALFSVRVTHHVLIAGVLAPLFVFALPANHRRVRGSLAVWTALQTLTFWLWHSPGLYAAALSNDLVYWVMQLTLLGTAIGFWSALRQVQAPAAVAALLLSTVQMGLLGALILFAPSALYAPHYLTSALWGFGVLEDQQLAGLIMWVPSAGLYLASALFVTSRWFVRETGGLA